MKNSRTDAHWEQRTHLFRKDEFICSRCGWSTEKPQKECPRCNVAMKGSKYNPTWVDEAEIMDIIWNG